MNGNEDLCSKLDEIVIHISLFYVTSMAISTVVPQQIRGLYPHFLSRALILIERWDISLQHISHIFVGFMTMSYIH